MGYLETISKGLDKLARWIVQISVAVMTLAIVAQVVWRYFLQHPLIWTEELARYALVWMSFIGAGVALRAKELAYVDLFISKLPIKAQKNVFILVDITNTVLIGFLMYYGLLLIGLPSVTMQKSPAMNIPMNYVYLGVPVGLGIMFVQSIVKLVKNFGGEVR